MHFRSLLRSAILYSAALFIAGCYAPLPGPTSYTADSLARPYGRVPELSDGIEIWRNGGPDRPFEVIAETTVDRRLLLPGDHEESARIADAVRKMGGDGAIVRNTRTFSEATNTDRHVYVSTVERIEIAVIRFR